MYLNPLAVIYFAAILPVKPPDEATGAEAKAERRTPMNIKMDPETGVLYLRAKGSEGTPGLVDETAEVEEGVYLDLDANMKPVGMEFLSIEDFEAFLKKYLEGIEILDSADPRAKSPVDQILYGFAQRN